MDPHLPQLDRTMEGVDMGIKPGLIIAVATPLS